MILVVMLPMEILVVVAAVSQQQEQVSRSLLSETQAEEGQEEARFQQPFLGPQMPVPLELALLAVECWAQEKAAAVAAHE